MKVKIELTTKKTPLVLCRGWNELLGILVGHVFFFLMYKYPQDFGGAQFISTPQIL